MKGGCLKRAASFCFCRTDKIDAFYLLDCGFKPPRPFPKIELLQGHKLYSVHPKMAHLNNDQLAVRRQPMAFAAAIGRLINSGKLGCTLCSVRSIRFIENIPFDGLAAPTEPVKSFIFVCYKQVAPMEPIHFPADFVIISLIFVIEYKEKFKVLTLVGVGLRALGTCHPFWIKPLLHCRGASQNVAPQ